MIAFSMVTTASLASPVTQDGDDAHKQLNLAMEQATKNKADPLLAGQYLHDAYNIAFQMGDYPLAKKLLASSVSQGVELAVWDNVALAEIFAREGDYEKAKGRLSFAINSFKAGKCLSDPLWKKFLSALENQSQDKIAAILGSGDGPALLQTNPTVPATHKLSDVTFTSRDASLPKEIAVNLVIDARGRVQCVTLAAEDKQHSKMLLAMKTRNFKPAKVGDKSVWQYGKTYVVQFREGNEMVMEEMRSQHGKVFERAPIIRPKSH